MDIDGLARMNLDVNNKKSGYLRGFKRIFWMILD
jgi:hypothetical protein